MDSNKGFYISDEDLKIFAEWIKKPGSVEKILESHKKVLSVCLRIEKMGIINTKLIGTPFTI